MEQSRCSCARHVDLDTVFHEVLEAARIVSVAFVVGCFFEIFFSFETEESLEIFDDELFHREIRKRCAHVLY